MTEARVDVDSRAVIGTPEAPRRHATATSHEAPGAHEAPHRDKAPHTNEAAGHDAPSTPEAAAHDAPSTPEAAAHDAPSTPEEYVPTVVVGGGQAGLAVGYHLARRGLPFVILDDGERIGDPWRHRWDSLTLFTPAGIDGLDGKPFPGPPAGHPSKDEVADYLEAYARTFSLPVRLRTRVTRLARDDGGFVLTTTSGRLRTHQVVVAMSALQVPKVPQVAANLDPAILSMHAGEYRSPDQLRPGGVLVVGTGNSGAEISVEVSRTHRTWLAGDEPKAMPFRIDSFFGTHVAAHVIRLLFMHVLTTRTPIGRRVRPRMIAGPDPLLRDRPKELRRAGVQRVARVTAVRDGLPVAGDDVLDVANVIWCTGYRGGLDWIDLPVFDDDGPRQDRGVVAEAPGLYFVGLNFLFAKASETLPGVSRDARHVVEHLARTGQAAAARHASPRRPDVVPVVSGSTELA